MAEKNYIMQAVVPEAPRTIDEQQLHVYVPQGSTDNFGVFKPDGQQFVITEDGILRVDASKLIQLATPSAQVVEDGGETGVYIAFTEPNNTLNRKFQFIFENIKGEPGTPGRDGDDGVSITSVTQTGVQGGTQVTITLSNGQSTSFIVYNGINTNFKVVNALPTENISTSTIYLVPSATPEAENVYDEYIYVNGDWEHIGSTAIDLSGKLDKVTEVTPNIQFYSKAPDGSQVMTEIKGGNGITVGAASDNKFLEVKVGDTINLTANQSITFNNAEYDTPIFKLTSDSIDLDPSGNDSLNILTGGEGAIAVASTEYGSNIMDGDYPALVSADPGVAFRYMHPYYQIGGIPTSSTSGTLPDNTSWNYLVNYPQNLRIRFNNEFYQLADNEHTTGTLVFSHVGYENEQLIVKTITITIATRGWVLTTVKPAKEPYHLEMEGTVPVSADEFAKLLADENSYILWKATSSATAQYKLRRNRTTTDTIDYSSTESSRILTLAVRSGQEPILYNINAQTTTQKTTALSSSSTDNQYPTAKATYDADQATLTAANNYTDTAIANAITTALNTPV